LSSSPNPEVIGFIAIGHTLLAVGRFFAAFAQLFLKPRWILLVLYLGAILFSILSMTMTGYIGIAMALLLFFFSAGIFSITFAICLRGMGGHSITAAAIMATAISGGAPFPVIQDVVAASRGTRYAMCVTVALFSFGAVFPLYLNLVTAAQKQVDPVQNEYLDHSPSGSHHDTPYLLEILRVSR
jgi:fucose permease